MGRKPVGQRQCLLLHLAVGLMGLILLSGCQHLQTEVSPTEDVLRQAQACQRVQDFACAASLLTPVLHPQTGPADPRVIYQAGLVAVDARNPRQDYQAAGECFRRLVTDHAESPLAADAAVWLGLIGQMHSQAEALEQLKTANASMQREIGSQKAHLRRMEKRLERLKAIDLLME